MWQDMGKIIVKSAVAVLYTVTLYRIRGNFGGDFNLAIWRILDHAAKLTSRQYNWSFVIINDVYR